MGITDKILSFGNTKRGKVISWSFVVGFTIIFFIGILLVSIPNRSTPRLVELNFTASNLAHKSVALSFNEKRENRTVIENSFHLTVSQPETFLGVVANPISSRANVNFTTNSEYISFAGEKTANVRAGGTLRINLEKDIEDQYGFRHFRQSDPEINAGLIEIIARSGHLVERIYVRIILNQSDFQLTAVLEQSPINPSTGKPTGNWTSAENISIKQIDPSVQEPTIAYRIRLRFAILDELLHDTANTADFGAFEYRELFHIYSTNSQRTPINGGDNTLILFSDLNDTILKHPNIHFENTIARPFKPFTIEYDFRINKTEYFTSSNLMITLVP